MVTDKRNRIVLVNNAFIGITGYGKEEVIGKNPKILCSGRQENRFYEAMWQSINETGHWAGEIWNRRKNGEIYPEWLSIDTVRNKANEITHYVGIFIDITNRKEIERQMHSLAYRDSLTGLANRNLLKDRLEQAILRSVRNLKYVAVMFLDLDQFKLVNDTLGHHAGDELLKEVAIRLKSNVREGDTIARMGGDEFVMVMADIAAKEEVSSIAAKLIKAFSEPFVVEHKALSVSTSIGIAIYPENGEDETCLFKNADAALYRAKEDGKNCFRFYSKDMNALASKRFELDNDLRLALKRHEFTLNYQPQVDLRKGCVTGVEALVRWNHPIKGLVPPSDFIPVTEETGMIVELGEWILRTACLDARKWHDHGFKISVAVNVSMRQLKDKAFPEMVKMTLEDSGFDPEYLELEVTESMLLHHPDKVRNILDELNLLGIKVSIDDFGTGYSSLSHLKNLPVDKLKIDQSFVRDITVDPDDAAITRMVIALAHSMNMKVIAEGVETEDQLKFLQKEQCDEMQGYYFSKPVPSDEMTRILASGKHLDISRETADSPPCC